MKNNRPDPFGGRPGLGLYIHIPFCVRKCAYCDFLSFPSDEAARRAYTSALVREIRLRGNCLRENDSGDYDRLRPVTSVFLGGGTPTVLEPDCLRDIFEAVYSSFDVAEDAEISMEMNPGTDRPELDDIIQNYVNRISLGLQSFRDSELKELGRIHTKDDFLRTYEHLKGLKACRLNVDLMSALPGQTVASWVETLRSVSDLKPGHISAYSLIIEEGTPFAARAAEGKLALPDEESERAMYEVTEEVLSERGYHRYEISNYAKKGEECRHNLLYWTMGEYLGAGLGASSFLNGTRFRNTASLPRYLELLSDSHAASSRDSTFPWVEESHCLSREELMEETLFLGLRLTEGVSAGHFEERFGRTLDDIYGGVIERHVRDGLIRRTDDGIALTKRGLDISNTVMADYLLG